MKIPHATWLRPAALLLAASAPLATARGQSLEDAAKALLARAESYVERGQYPMAVATYKALVQKYPMTGAGKRAQWRRVALRHRRAVPA